MDVNKWIDKGTALAYQFGIQLLVGIVILIVGMWLARRITNIVRKMMIRREVDLTITHFLANLCYGILIAFVLIAVLSQVGVQTASIIAVLGAAGLAVGFALQGTLSNFASGIMLIALRPVRVGDYVEAGGVGGTVEEISLFWTRLVTPDNKVITVPNTSVTSGAITNYSVKEQRRVDLTIGVSYDTDIDTARAEIKAVLDAETRILPDRDVVIVVKELADSSVNFVVRVWVNSGDYWPTFFDLTENIKKRFDQSGISIPFPQMDVHLSKED